MAKSNESPVREYKMLDGGGTSYINRLMVAIPTTGVIRIEWHSANVGMVVPVNWSQVIAKEVFNPYIAINYQVADAQNVLVKTAIERDFEWILFYEHDVLPPADALLKLNQYIREESHPVVSGLYYTRAGPSEPLIFRGRGNSVYTDFKLGDKVWASGVPTGFLLVHMGLMRAMWDESPEYKARNVITRRVFESPTIVRFNAEANQISTFSGTSDLNWCNRVMDEGYFAKSGWGKFQRKKYPFLVDTSILCKHINLDGSVYP